MEKLIWTKTTPTEIGWYWKREPLSKFNGQPEIVLIRSYAGDLAIGNCILRGWKSVEEWDWAGPIPMPIEK